MATAEDDFGEERANLQQRIGYLENQVERLVKPLTESGLNEIALLVAERIEDLFAQHHDGGRSQRLARAQIIVREAMRANLSGSADWNYPNNLRDILPPQQPVRQRQ